MMNQELAKACENMIKEGSSTFYNAFRHLPSPKKEAVYVIYSFCRMIDDSVDEPEKSPYTLDEIEHHFTHLDQAEGHFIWEALRWLFDSFPVSKQPFLVQMKGQRSDMVHTPFLTLEDLETYCYHVAGSVGEMLLPVLHDHPTDATSRSGIALGKAMQIVNIIRDIGEDQDRGRRYVPAVLMAKHGYNEIHFDNGLINSSFISLIHELMAIATEWFQEGLKEIESYPKESAFCIQLAAGYYASILKVVEANHYDVFTKRAIVNTAQKARILNEILHLEKTKKATLAT